MTTKPGTVITKEKIKRYQHIKKELVDPVDLIQLPMLRKSIYEVTLEEQYQRVHDLSLGISYWMFVDRVCLY